MSATTERNVKPQLPIAVLMGAAGAAKLLGVPPTKANFARWGYGGSWRRLIGAVEVATAGAAWVGRENHSARQAAAAGTLVTMGGAIATHTVAGDAIYNYVAPLALIGLAVAALYDVSLVLAP